MDEMRAQGEFISEKKELAQWRANGAYEKS